jgi:two-component system, LytTR family, sensor histidine kinase AlgZ
LISFMLPFFNRHRVTLLHLSFWSVYVSFFLYQVTQFWQGRAIDWSKLLSVAAVNIFFTLLISYFNYFVLLPRFLARKSLVTYLLQFGAFFALAITLRIHLERWVVDGYTHRAQYIYTIRFLIYISAITLFITLFVAMLRFAKDWFELQARAKTIENEKLSAELNFLKAQINPHFLFNTLNNLYYLAFTQSPNTTEVIEKLSHMMRYMIYDSNHPRVVMRKEIEYMQNYISLERLRLNDQIAIDFQVEGNPDEVRIMPLILITFLENAFKHGVANNDPGAWIKIYIGIHEKTLTYTVENSKLARKSQVSREKSGIGLANVQRRLELSYPEEHTLLVEDQPNRYFIQLKLQLN